MLDYSSTRGRNARGVNDVESLLGSRQSVRKETTDLHYEDFMPLERRTGKPVAPNKPGSLHFHCNLGSSYDGMITEMMNSFVPKHKSWLKEKDLVYVPKKTKEEENAINEKQKNKSGIDIMFEQVSKDQKELEKHDRGIHTKVECGRPKKVKHD